MKNTYNSTLQYFQVANTKQYFQTYLNGNGYYNPDHNTILGGLLDGNGQLIETKRINFSLLRPLTFHQTQMLFEDKTEEIINKF